MRSSEWVAWVYFVYLLVACWLKPLPARRRLGLTGASLSTVGVIEAVSATASPLVRDWIPLLYVSVAYYLTGWLFVRPSETLESWLLSWDHRLLGDPTTRFSRWPAFWVEYLQAVYMGCFLILPGGLAVLILAGHRLQANRYWTMVLAADMGAFAPLSVFQTRPPWNIEAPAVLQDRHVRRLAAYLVRHATIGVNTFPSGHVAVSFAAAFAVLPAMPLAGLVLFILATSISLACIVGRYHYVMDVCAGAVLAGAVWVVVTSLGI